MAARPPPAKPWERAGGGAASRTAGSPFAPASVGSTSDVVASAGTAGDEGRSPEAEDAALSRAMPSRPWESSAGAVSGVQDTYGSVTPYGRPGVGLGSSGYSSLASNYPGTSRYGGMYGAGSSMYGAGSSMYGAGSSMYGGGYGGSTYGGGVYGNRMGGYGGYGGYGNSGYGGGTYGSSYGGYGGMGGSYGGYSGMGGMAGMGMMAGVPGDPNDPNFQGDMQPPRAPAFWLSCLRVMHGVMTAFGRLSILVDENTHAFHFFITALLQLFDRAGVLYGEVARFVLRLLGFRSRSMAGKKGQAARKGELLPKADAMHPSAPISVARQLPAPRQAAPEAGGWDKLWPGN